MVNRWWGAVANCERERSEELEAGEGIAGLNVLLSPIHGDLGVHKSLVIELQRRDK